MLRVVIEPRATASDARTMRVVRRADDDYPALLRQSAVAPPELFVRGRLDAEDALAVAIVGARQATPYGIETAEWLAGDLARRGVTVVSGLARGIDSAAHRGALQAGGRTIAVLGSGVDVVYPPENRRLAVEIVARGALVSELPPGTPPLPYHFPLRNRIIAGLALAVVVVEAAEKSGSLGTARWAADLGREVMAVPGRVTSAMSRGAHQLLRDGATLVESVEDVVRELPAPWRACVRPAVAQEGSEATGAANGAVRGIDDRKDDEEARRLLAAIGEDPVTIEEVIERSGVASGRAAALLLDLELEGRVRQLTGKRFVRPGRV
jgi:DNA processing protein